MRRLPAGHCRSRVGSKWHGPDALKAFAADPDISLEQEDPFVLFRKRNFLQPDEIEQLLHATGSDAFKNPYAGTGATPQNIRSSRSTVLPAKNAATQRVRTRIASLAQVEEDRIEPLQIVQYRQGQAYAPHIDWSTHPVFRVNNRVYSMLVLLQQADEGGETAMCEPRVFGANGRAFRLEPGEALCWSNLDRRNCWTTDNRHEARQVQAGVKIALNVWIRQTTHDLAKDACVALLPGNKALQGDAEPIVRQFLQEHPDLAREMGGAVSLRSFTHRAMDIWLAMSAFMASPQNRDRCERISPAVTRPGKTRSIKRRPL